MTTFDWIIALLLGAVALSALARRIGVPYPTFLAVGGVLLAIVPSIPSWTLEPKLALALFVAPVLLDAAYDTSLRDLRNNWLPVSTLVILAVCVTTSAVAILVHGLLPDMPWSAAIALGAIVAPPDAAAATTILRQVMAFAVVLGSLVIQGLTLRPLILALRLKADNLVAGEVAHARGAAYARR